MTISTTTPSATLCWLLVQRIFGLGAASMQRIMQKLEDVQQLFTLTRQQLQSYELSPVVIEQILTPNWQQAEQDAAWLAKHTDTQLVSLFDSNYPPLLKEIASPPLMLFMQGEVGLAQQAQLAMVGSRNPTPAGKEAATQFARYFAQTGMVVTSGMALGVDGCSHRGALQAKGKTIAVVGTGIDKIYPQRHRRLAEEIRQHGLIISEYPLGTAPSPENFPRRNRIISGLSMGVLVVEAALQSGSLITAQAALEQGREVFAIPGSIHNPLSKGNHRLLKQGAKLVETAQDVLDELTGFMALYRTHSPNPAKAAQANPHLSQATLSDVQRHLLACLSQEPTHIDDVIQRSQIPANEVVSLLAELELQGVVEHQLGRGYTLV
jgi:DNA processing protein